MSAYHVIHCTTLTGTKYAFVEHVQKAPAIRYNCTEDNKLSKIAFPDAPRYPLFLFRDYILFSCAAASFYWLENPAAELPRFCTPHTKRQSNSAPVARQSQKNSQARGTPQPKYQIQSPTVETPQPAMGLRTLGLLALCVLLPSSTLAHDMATNSSSSSSSSESVAQLLADVQAAVADDPALANLFDVSGASQMSEAELTTLLQEILSVSLSGSGSTSVSGSSSASLTAASAESTQSASAAGSTVSGAVTSTLSTMMTALAVAGALYAAL